MGASDCSVETVDCCSTVGSGSTFSEIWPVGQASSTKTGSNCTLFSGCSDVTDECSGGNAVSAISDGCSI